MQTTHTSVLLQEVVEGLALDSGDVFVDGTLGGGGHSEAVARRFGNSVKIIGLDLDTEALLRSESRLRRFTNNFILKEGNFRNMNRMLDSVGIERVNGILLDLGFSSDQLESSGRGLSFQKNEPLIMTLGAKTKDYPFTAHDIVNEWEEGNIADIIRGYGEERFAGRISHAIVAARQGKVIETTGELAEIISRAVPGWYRQGKINPATRTFQALRIAVNDELAVLKEGLERGFTRLEVGGRMAVVSFHSLEDRIVKHFFKELEVQGAKLITKKPIVATEFEKLENPRSRSAKLRIIEKQ